MIANVKEIKKEKKILKFYPNPYIPSYGLMVYDIIKK